MQIRKHICHPETAHATSENAGRLFILLNIEIKGSTFSTAAGGA